MNNTKTADDFINEFLVVHDTVGLQRTEIRNMLHAYGEAQKPKWISVKDQLPETNNIMGSGNKYSGDVLVTDGEDYYVANLESVRPKFEKQHWVITQSDDLVVEYSGREVTHWMKLPELP